MAISFPCKCGRQLKVSDAMAGRVGQCPSCGATVQIPSSSDAYDVARFIDEGQRPCPACTKPMPTGAVICVHCGYHRIAGTRLKTLEEERREEKPARLRLLGVSVPAWSIVAVVLAIAAVAVWYGRGPARPLLIERRQYVHVIEPLSDVTTLPGGVRSIGGDEALIVATPDPAGPFLLIEVALQQGAIRDAGQTRGRDSLFNDQQFELAPADGSPPLPARVLARSFDERVTLDLAAASTASFQAAFPPIQPTQMQDLRQAGGVTTGKARWLEPGIMGDVEFTSVIGMGGGASTGNISAHGSLQIADANHNVVEMRYTGHELRVAWPDDCVGWWAPARWTRPTRTNNYHRHTLALLVERPAAAGTHTLTYCGQPVARLTTSEAPPPRSPAASPLKPKTTQQHAQGQARANNPINYLGSLSRARQRGQGLVAANNMRQFAFAMQMFIDQHRRHPESLLELVDFDPALRGLLANPRTGEMPGYIYEPPPPGSSPSDTPVMWESLAGQKDPEGAVLYADGHLE